jgi:hypothetical protein
MDRPTELAGPGLRYTLLDADRRPRPSPTEGAVGGHRRSRIYGRLDCPAALRAIARGGYVAHRVFFADAAAAEQAGYRPCAVCFPDAYRAWKRAATTARHSPDGPPLSTPFPAFAQFADFLECACRGSPVEPGHRQRSTSGGQALGTPDQRGSSAVVLR